jgi:hypothetical protein
MLVSCEVTSLLSRCDIGVQMYEQPDVKRVACRETKVNGNKVEVSLYKTAV